MVYLMLLLVIICAISFISSIVCASEMSDDKYKDCNVMVLMFIALCPIVNTLHIIKSVRNKKISLIKDFKKYF